MIWKLVWTVFSIEHRIHEALCLFRSTSLYIFQFVNSVGAAQEKFTHVQEHDFVKDHYWGIGKNYRFMGWLVSYSTI